MATPAEAKRAMNELASMPSLLIITITNKKLREILTRLLTKEDKEADVIRINLMANANYNPLASIFVLTRQTQTTWGALLAKPANADRAMNIYDYTAYAYPQKLKAGYSCNEYKNFLTYAQSVLDSRKNNKKLASKSLKEVKKYRKYSVAQISKFKTRGGLSTWDAIYGVLNEGK